jgi:hypothetical protein
MSVMSNPGDSLLRCSSLNVEVFDDADVLMLPVVCDTTHDTQSQHSQTRHHHQTNCLVNI